MRFDFYRQATYHKLSAALDDQNRPSAWHHRLVSTSIREFWGGKPEGQEIEGADVTYAIPNVTLEYAPVPTSIPRAWWRSVANSFNAFVVQSFMDELAHAANRDPLEFRLALLPETKPPKSGSEEGAFESDRMRAVMNEAATRSGWGKPLPKGRARGFAAHYSFGSYVAQVAEVSVDNNNPQVHRVTCVVDCGRAVNPDGVKAQMEGAIIYGLSAALSGEITIKDGAVEQGNFDDYPIARIFESPETEVFVITSDKHPTGCGEPGVPPIAPAVTNAVFALTGQRIRKLPIRLT